MTIPSTPGSCGIMGLLKAGTAFDTTIISTTTALQGSLTASLDKLAGLPQALQGIAVTDITALQGRISAVATGAVNSFISHVTTQIAGLVSNLAMSTGLLSVQKSLTGSGCSTPTAAASKAAGGGACSSTSDAFGSLTGSGSSLIGSMTSGLNSLTGQIQMITSGALKDVSIAMKGLNDGIAYIEGQAAMVTALISKEVAQLSSMLNDLLNFTHASTLFGLLNDPCAKAVLAAAGTPALNAQLGMPATDTTTGSMVVPSPPGTSGTSLLAQSGSDLAKALDANPTETLVIGGTTYNPPDGTVSTGTIYYQNLSGTVSNTTATPLASAGSPLAAALDANPNTTVVYGDKTYDPVGGSTSLGTVYVQPSVAATASPTPVVSTPPAPPSMLPSKY